MYTSNMTTPTMTPNESWLYCFLRALFSASSRWLSSKSSISTSSSVLAHSRVKTPRFILSLVQYLYLFLLFSLSLIIITAATILSKAVKVIQSAFALIVSIMILPILPFIAIACVLDVLSKPHSHYPSRSCFNLPSGERFYYKWFLILPASKR